MSHPPCTVCGFPLQECRCAVPILPPMPPEVRRLVEAANHGASYASHVHGGHNAVEQIESAIAAVRRIFRSEP